MSMHYFLDAGVVRAFSADDGSKWSEGMEPISEERAIALASQERNQPKRCTPAQGLVALFALKQITEDHVLDAIAQIPDPVQQYTARIGYQRATTWERGSQTMIVMAQLLQLSDEDLDTLFSYAAGVQV